MNKNILPLVLSTRQGLIKQMELLPRWQLLLLWVFMETYTSIKRLAKSLERRFR